VIADDPVGILGTDVVDRFGPHLPFLLKVLAAQKSLSIQVHPTLEQARAGFAAEAAAGIPRDAPQRNYRDANHKPELICALTPFEALSGFRPIEQTLAALAELDVPELGFLADLLRGPDPLRAASRRWVGTAGRRGRSDSPPRTSRATSAWCSPCC
jgi:mannose-6-phosphate isomerase